jgi:hypothetical protein
MRLNAYLMPKKITNTLQLLAAGRATLGNALSYLLGIIFQFIDKGLPIDLVKHVTGFLFTVQDSGLMQEIQMSGNDRPVLGQVIGDGADVRSSVLHQKL